MTLLSTLKDTKVMKTALARAPRGLQRPALKRRTVNVGRARDWTTVVITLKLKSGPQVSDSIRATHDGKLKHRIERFVDKLMATNEPVVQLGRLTVNLPSETSAAAKHEPVVRTKVPKDTIGVTSSVALHDVLDRQATKAKIAFAVIARNAFETGLKQLDARRWDESTSSIAAESADSYARFGAGQTSQWSLRVSRDNYLKAVFLAKEFGVSQSQLACWCLAVATNDVSETVLEPA